jgi:putative transposase
LSPSELRRLKDLERENSQLKKLVAELSLDKEILQDVLRRNPEACTQAGLAL